VLAARNVPKNYLTRADTGTARGDSHALAESNSYNTFG
jgi:hypothetical protein